MLYVKGCRVRGGIHSFLSVSGFSLIDELPLEPLILYTTMTLIDFVILAKLLESKIGLIT